MLLWAHRLSSRIRRRSFSSCCLRSVRAWVRESERRIFCLNQAQSEVIRANMLDNSPY